jgi:predicted  nucleic acid-binding Zn-ribbon protein
MAEPTTNIRCTQCGALLKTAGKRTLVRCELCGTEQSLRADDRDDDEEYDEDAPDSEPWVEDPGDADEPAEPEEARGPLENAECLALLQRYLEEAGEDYDGAELVIELDEENTDDERVYLYVKDADGEVLDYFLVDREDGGLETYDYETEQWDEV